MMNTEIRNQIATLNKTLEDAAAAYYIKSQPLMTDSEFDRLEKRLRELVANNPDCAQLATYLNKVGSDLTSSSARVPHQTPMLSIENQYTEEDFLAQFDEWGGLPVVLEPKFDGISVSLTYVDGKLKQAVTRGDGASGEVMTSQIMACPLIPLGLTLPGTVEIRGELVMAKSQLQKLNDLFTRRGEKTYSSTRNLTAGTMKLKNNYAAITERGIQMRPWDVIGEGLSNSRLMRLAQLAKEGFSQPEGVLISDRGDIIHTLKVLLHTNKLSDIQADGVVMKVDSIPACQRLGVSSKYTNYQTCFKPQDDRAETTLLKVVWQVGRTGKVTPVAECEPVTLAGAVITRANINNISWIKDIGLTLGSRIEMLRSGGVIPKIERVIQKTDQPIEIPTHCPECATELNLTVTEDAAVDRIQLYCVNLGCPGRMIDHFNFIGSRELLEIDGLGPELATKLVHGDYARNVGELVEFADDTMALIAKNGEDAVVQLIRKQGFSIALIKMVKSIQTAKTASWDRWIAALGIPMISESLGKVVAKEMALTTDDMGDLANKLSDFSKRTVAGVGPSKKKALQMWLGSPANKSVIATLSSCGVKPSPVTAEVVVEGAPLAGTAFCITGEFGEGRDVITKKLESLGAVSKSSVTKNCNLLIIGTVPGATKVKAAEKLGTKTVNESWLREVLTKNGLTLAAQKFAVEDI